MSFELILLLLVLYLNIVATYHVATSKGYEFTQKTYQLVLAWLVPVIGSAIVIAFVLSDKDHVTDLKSKKGIPAQLVRILTLTTIAGGGSMQGIGDDGYGDGFDGGGCDGGGDGGD